MDAQALREKARTLPVQPGVYLWKDEEGRVLYVGKAQDLRSRALQYFGPQEDERKAFLMKQARNVDFLVVENVKEALVLEQTLIKQHRPPFNVTLVDDKRYPYIAFTDEAWPRIVYTRNLQQRAHFFGPFPDAGKAKRVARLLSRTFRLRQCRTLPTRECLYYHLQQCSAPCINAVSASDYERQVRDAQAFLKGKGTELAGRVRRDMEAAAAEQRFEKAAELRDLLSAIESVLERQKVDTLQEGHYDAVGVAVRDRRACCLVLPVRGGAVVGRESYFLSVPEHVTTPDILASFLEQFYTLAPNVPQEVLLPVPVEEANLLARTISELHERDVKLRVPERGDRRRFVEMAEKNAHVALEQEFLIRERRKSEALEALQAALGLPDPPARIECFDVSHHHGEHTVAAMVAFSEGAPRKSDYRRFKIRTTSGGDDPGALHEAVQRRYERVLREEGADALPDLIVIDGGPTQLAAARRALAALGLDELPTIGLAKRLEEIYRPHHLHPLRLDPADPGLHLLQRVRDEAHRFAIGYQGTLKRTAFIQSSLDEVPGVGPERRRRLLATFGSVDAIRRATPDQLAQVPGIPRPLAARILEALRQQQPSSRPRE